jgi:hypothetical protein
MFICFPFLISLADFDSANTALIRKTQPAAFYSLFGLYTTIILLFLKNLSPQISWQVSPAYCKMSRLSV